MLVSSDGPFVRLFNMSQVGIEFVNTRVGSEA